MRPTPTVLLCIGIIGGARLALANEIDADPSSYKAAVAALQPGDTLHLAAGHYPRLQITNLNGSQGAWITITGPAVYPRTAIIDADPGGCCNTVEISNSSFVALENVMIDGHDIEGEFGISAGGGTNNLVHDIRIEDCSIVNHHGGQQHDGISTKTPTWGWIIRKNEILRAGTGLYLGNSDGSDPFVGGLIEGNVVDGPIGYCMEIKYQTPRPTVTGMPTSPTTTIIRNNTFIKNDDPSPDGDRPNVLVGGFPATGAGSTDRYEIYGNLFLHNPREALFQGSGRLTIHDNLFVDGGAIAAMVLRDHDLPLEQAYVYNNTIYSVPVGIDLGNTAPQGDAVVGNLIFAATPIKGPAHASDNVMDTTANAGNYVNSATVEPSTMNFYPLVGTCKASAIDTSLFMTDTDYAIDYNGVARGFEFRGAYAGEGTNPGQGAGSGSDDPDSPDAGTTSSNHSGGCGIAAHDGTLPSCLLALGLLGARRRRTPSRDAE